MENIVKLAMINTHIHPLMNMIQDIHDKLEELNANEIFQYALGGLAFIQANYKDSNETEQKLYENIVYNSLHDAQILKNQIDIYMKQPLFQQNPTQYIYHTLKNKYHNLFELIKIGQ